MKGVKEYVAGYNGQDDREYVCGIIKDVQVENNFTWLQVIVDGQMHIIESGYLPTDVVLDVHMMELEDREVELIVTEEGYKFERFI